MNFQISGNQTALTSGTKSGTASLPEKAQEVNDMMQNLMDVWLWVGVEESIDSDIHQWHRHLYAYIRATRGYIWILTITTVGQNIINCNKIMHFADCPRSWMIFVSWMPFLSPDKQCHHTVTFHGITGPKFTWGLPYLYILYCRSRYCVLLCRWWWHILYWLPFKFVIKYG